MMYLYVALGGAIGAVGRFGLHALIAPEPGKFPTATFVANVLGCFLMGIIYVLIVEKQFVNPNLRPFVMVGFLGAFTTFSSFAIEALSLWHAEQISLAITYALGSLFSCLLAVWVGYSLCEKIIH